jgi:hypothetical protein
LCEPASLRVALEKICDTVSSHNRQDLIQVLYQHIMYVISLSNISIKTNFKQITRVELIFTICFTILLGKLHFEHRVTSFVAVLSPMSNYCSITTSVTIQPDNAFKKEMWTLQLPEILKLCLWKWEHDHEFTIRNMNEWTLNSRFVYVANIDVFSPHSNYMTSWQRSSTENVLGNVVPFFYHHSVVIQHVVSHRYVR